MKHYVKDRGGKWIDGKRHSQYIQADVTDCVTRHRGWKPLRHRDFRVFFHELMWQIMWQKRRFQQWGHRKCKPTTGILQKYPIKQRKSQSFLTGLWSWWPDSNRWPHPYQGLWGGAPQGTLYRLSNDFIHNNNDEMAYKWWGCIILHVCARGTNKPAVSYEAIQRVLCLIAIRKCRYTWWIDLQSLNLFLSRLFWLIRRSTVWLVGEP